VAGRVAGSKKCKQCGWIHLPEDPCKPPKAGTPKAVANNTEAVLASAPEPVVLTAPEASRAAIDMRMVLNRLAYLESRIALLEARLQ